jgi:hypothetical protein
LAVPKRALPLAGIGVALVSAEWLATRSLTALLVDLGLFVAFCLVAPTSFCRLCAPAHATPVRAVVSHLGYLLVCSAVIAALALGLPLLLAHPWTYVVEPGSMGLLLVLFAVGGWGLGRDIDLEADAAAERRRATQMAIAAERAQLLALRSHLDPHFLFNTLNAIAEWCRAEPLIAERAILHLAAMLRSMLDGIVAPTWKLKTELDLLVTLFDLHRIRDSQRYQLALHLPEPVPEADVPPMILLPLFENAVTHGPAAGHAGTVELRVATQDGVVVVEIRNPGPFTGRRPGGVGIELVERRLAHAYAGRAHLSVVAQGDTTVTTAILPLGLAETLR